MRCWTEVWLPARAGLLNFAIVPSSTMDYGFCLLDTGDKMARSWIWPLTFVSDANSLKSCTVLEVRERICFVYGRHCWKSYKLVSYGSELQTKEAGAIYDSSKFEWDSPHLCHFLPTTGKSSIVICIGLWLRIRERIYKRVKSRSIYLLVTDPITFNLQTSC
jgi:hypothetical protein